ncbi:MAG: hypothetical protein N3A59_05925 [Thermodesulfovibrionales bacterium]|nr:hypothetical protein [Thermodesulfovibrionales bacterium]
MFYDRKVEKNIPRCPFCEKIIEKPVVTTTDLGEIISGKCKCNAIYVCDLTGRSVGEAYMEALVLLKGDWDIGTLDPDSDYLYSDMDYDYKTHKKINRISLGETPGKLVFLKSTKDIQMDNIDNGDKVKKQKKTNLKQVIKKHLTLGELDNVVTLAMNDKNIINQLFSFTYDKSSLITWHAIECVGLIAEKLSPTDPEFIRNTARRLLWSMTEESGGISWTAPEMLGEIIRSNPEEYFDLIPILWSNRDEEVFKEGVIWAMIRIAEKAPDKVKFILNEAIKMLDDPNPTVKGYTILLLRRISNKEIINKIEKFKDDESEISLYTNRAFLQTTIGKITSETINSLL